MHVLRCRSQARLLPRLAGTLALMTVGGVAAYKWRLRREMQSEIRSIM
jgi:hypothetical protein